MIRKHIIQNIQNVMSKKPHLVVDDGDLISSLHKNTALTETLSALLKIYDRSDSFKNLAKEGRLRFPVVTVNDADTTPV